MIFLRDLIEENDELLQLKKMGLVAKRQASDLLSKKGLNDSWYFILRIKQFPGKTRNLGWVALYRHSSILSGKPIFWMNSDIREIMKDYDPDANIVRIFVDNILHEWWHAIMDFFRVMKFYRKVDIKSNFSPRVDQQEEEDAEDFMRWVGGESSDKEEMFKSAIEEFNNLWK